MQFHLKIVTPNRLFFEDDVDKIVVRGIMGDFAVLPNMSPFVTKIDINKLVLYVEGEPKVAAISGGYIDVRNNQVVIVANACEWPEEIDINRAEEAKRRAERRIKEKEGDIFRAELALKKAINRINLVD